MLFNTLFLFVQTLRAARQCSLSFVDTVFGESRKTVTLGGKLKQKIQKAAMLKACSELLPQSFMASAWKHLIAHKYRMPENTALLC